MVEEIHRSRTLVRLPHWNSRLSSGYKAAAPNYPTCLSVVTVTTVLQMMMMSDGFVLPPFREQNLEIVE
jgi:hypothetical protein